MLNPPAVDTGKGPIYPRVDIRRGNLAWAVSPTSCAVQMFTGLEVMDFIGWMGSFHGRTNPE